MADDLEATLATIAKMAPELAKQRVERVTVGDVSFVLLPHEEPETPADAKTKTVVVEMPPSPLSDPKTYGWTEGVPGFRDPRKKGTS